jgi:hypothetical protein
MQVLPSSIPRHRDRQVPLPQASCLTCTSGTRLKRVRRERLAGRFSLDQFGRLPHDVDNIGIGSLVRTNDLAGSLHQFVLLQLVDLFYLLRRTTHRIVWAMGNHRDADLTVGNRERLDLRAVAQQ